VYICCSPPHVGFEFDRHAAFGMQPCSEEAMDTVSVVRPPSVSSQNPTTAPSQLQPTTVAMDECDGNGITSISGDSGAQLTKLDQFSLPQPGVHFRPTTYAAVPCHVISQQPFSDTVHLTSGGMPVPSVPVSVPCYAVRQMPPSQPLVQPQVYYRPADGFCVTASTQLTLEEPQYSTERS